MDLDYYETHYGELLAQYPDQWIAILGPEGSQLIR